MGMMIHRNRLAAEAKSTVPTSSQVEDTPKKEEETKYTKKDIQFMKTEDLKALGKELGLDEELTGKDLKPLIIERLGL